MAVAYAPPHIELAFNSEMLETAFPLTPALEQAYSIEGKRAFLDSYLPIRDEIEARYYAEQDKKSTPGARSRKFLGSMLNPIIGRPMRDAEQFYQTFGRLMRRAWLSISVGLYTDEIQRVQNMAERLLLAQVHNVDMNWRPAVSHIANELDGRGTIVEIGTGRGNSVIRLAQLLPNTQIISVTISPEQRDIVQEIVREMRLPNVEVRLGNFFEPKVTSDLVGRANATGAIEVVLHFPEERKHEGMQRMASLIKPGSPLSLIDSSIAKPMSNFSKRYYANQSIYFGQRQQYFDLFENANLTAAAYIDYTPSMNQSFRETTKILRGYRKELREEFGWLMSYLWPEVPGNLYIKTLGNIRYVQAVGIKN